MDVYDACIHEVNQHFTEGRVQAGLKLAIDACRHRGPEPEPRDLRDARTDMLTKGYHVQKCFTRFRQRPHPKVFDQQVFQGVLCDKSSNECFNCLNY